MKRNKAYKRRAALGTALLLCALLSGCGVSARTQYSPALLYQKGLALLQRTGALAQDEGYVRAFTGNASLQRLAGEMGAQDYGAPQTVYAVEGLEEAYLSLLSQSAQEGAPLSGQAQAAISQRAAASLGSLINGLSGVEQVAAASLLTVQQAFVCSGLSQSVVYLYLYEGPYAGLVAFTPYEEETVLASACLFRRDALQGVRVQDVQALLQLLGLSSIRISPVNP